MTSSGVKMNGIQRRKCQNVEEPFPGCLGRMVNLFDLNTGITGNRLLTDKPHHDGFTHSRSRSDVGRMGSPFGDKMEDKLMVSEFKKTSSNKKANGTPMKMLIDQEMSKEINSKNNPPNVVAKLMGLDAFPRQQPHSSIQISHTNSYSRSTSDLSGLPSGCWQQEDVFSERRMQFEVHQCPENNEYKDVYEVWQQPQNPSYGRDESPQKGKYNEYLNDKKMALVRQKFVEAKRLATDEKLRQSKEFQDALEVLSSNGELFLKFLQEPNSLFSQHLYDLQSIPPPPETKRITVLRPSKMVDNSTFSVSGQMNDKKIKKPAQMSQGAVWDKSPGHSPMFTSPNADECPTQPTRIVVLKPSPGKTHDIKAVVSSTTLSPRILHGENLYEELEDEETRESREVAKVITQKMHDNLMGHRRDETLLSSVFSNGYTGDESSFNKSENEYAAENLSDSEVMSPSSRHSWDYINRFGSPFSSSSFSRASCSPESSVCREAKKRLSERWAMMASNGNSQEQRHVRRSSSTLGEMLALSDMKKAVRSEDEGGNREQEPRDLVSCLTGNPNNEEGMGDSPRNLVRSKSVPVSSTVYGARLNVEVSDSAAGKTDVSKELTKAKSMKSSLRGKVSSLFFSRNKKSSREKSGASQSKDESQAASAGTLRSKLPPSKISDAAPPCASESGLEECFSPVPCVSSGKASPDLTNIGLKQGIVSREAGLSLMKPMIPRNATENQDQPSPISVLEPSFEEDDITRESSSYVKPDDQRSLVPLKSNLIDKSPPIGSIARTLSWDDSCAETATPYQLRSSLVSTGAKEEEKDWLALVQSLLSAAGLNDGVRCDSFFSRWHSLNSPLDPSLRDKYANVNGKETMQMHEGKRRQLRSSRKLVFDCVNAALADCTGYGSDTSVRSTSCGGPHERLMEGDSPLLEDLLWARMKEWFSSEVRCVSGDEGDSNSLVVEGVVRKEVVGKGWAEQMSLEIDNLGAEIEGKLLQELVEEAVVDLTGRI
ncbi:uncharacterized protein LOC107426464 isoform X1 [Ziziphus jujuba]|uniref:Uncharacterized protein LOC107426464 isoform X1 n=1 Tax=Ziziphus jujuba TaxID=326968 RepID=A0ABM3IWE6_ZIZJJ|nr:uncharacterized protein LOC107426464 isoform X1 [Ziziphus jujuba]